MLGRGKRLHFGWSHHGAGTLTHLILHLVASTAHSFLFCRYPCPCLRYARRDLFSPGSSALCDSPPRSLPCGLHVDKRLAREPSNPSRIIYACLPVRLGFTIRRPSARRGPHPTRPVHALLCARHRQAPRAHVVARRPRSIERPPSLPASTKRQRRPAPSVRDNKYQPARPTRLRTPHRSRPARRL